MRIVVHCHFPFDHLRPAGGVQRVAATLVTGLARIGHAPVVVCPPGTPSPPPPGVRVEGVLRYRDGAPYAPADQLADVRALEAAATGAGVVLSFDHPLPGRPPRPWVLVLGTLTYERPRTALASDRWSALAVPSAWLAAQAAGGQRPVVTIPNPVDLAPAPAAAVAAWRLRLGLTGDERVLLFPHRLDPGKGLETALAALALLVAHDPRFRLAIAIDPTAEAGASIAVRAAARAHGVEHAVIAHPWVARRDLAAHLTLGECSLTLSRLPEGFGMAPLEALACGTAAVSTRCGALGELVPAGAGVTYVATGDPRAVAAAVLRSASPRALERGRAVVTQRCAPERAVAAYSGLLERVADGPDEPASRV